MAIVTLREHQSTVVAASGMLQIQAFPAPGYDQPVRLSLTGDATVNTVSASELRLIRGAGTLEIVATPVAGDEFGPGTSIRLYLTRGRRGTPQEHGAEIVDITLDGRSETVIGTLTYEGGELVITSAVGASQNDQPFTGVAASVRAGLRALINRRGIDTSGLDTGPTHLALDTSVSMKHQVTQEDLEFAVDVFSGIVGALKPETTFVVDDDRTDRPATLGTRDELSTYACGMLGDGGNHIGSGARRAVAGPGNPTFAICDEPPYDSGGPGLSIVVGKAVGDNRAHPAEHSGVLVINQEFRDILAGDNRAAQDTVFEHILDSCLRPQAERPQHEGAR